LGSRIAETQSKEDVLMTDEWRKIERGLFESPDGQWRIANPWKLDTELRHRWLVAERRASGSGWCMHDGDHESLDQARSYVLTSIA
jgi:hypothetical protein